MADDLRISIVATLNPGKSVGEINTAIKGLERRINKLKLKIEVPQDFQRNIQSFINATNKMKAISDEQNKIVREEIEEFKRLDGTIEKHIKQVKANGEVVTKEIKKRDDSKKAIEAERKALEDLLDEQERFNKLKSVQERFGSDGKISGSNRVYSDGNQLLNIQLDNEDKVIKYTITDRIETEKLIKTKDELRKKLLELVQVGALSKDQIAKTARDINTAYDDDSIKAAKESLKVSQEASEERIRFLQLENKVSEEQAKQMAKWVKDEDRAHYEAFLEKEKREKHLISLVQDRLRAEELAYKENTLRNKSVQKTAPQRYLGEQVDLGRSVNFNANTNELTEYAKLVAGVGAEFTKVANKVDSAGNRIKEVSVRTHEGGKYWHNYAMTLEEATGKVYVMDKGLSDMAHRQLSIAERFKVMAQNIPLWFAGMTGFMGMINGVRLSIENLLTIDKQLTELRRVADPTMDVNNMLRTSISLANELGKSIQDINEAMIGFSRSGQFSEQQIAALTKTAIMAANVSELTVEESMSTMVSALEIFNVKAEDSIEIINQLNEVDNNFAVTTKDLAIGLQKSGSTAAAFGVTMSELIGHMTSIGVQTRESGAIVGNSLKTIYSRLTTMQPSIDALASIGINVRNANGDMKTATEIITELQNSWTGLNDETRQSLAVTLAGSKICPLFK